MQFISQSDLIENLNSEYLFENCSSLNDIYLTLELNGVDTLNLSSSFINKLQIYLDSKLDNSYLDVLLLLREIKINKAAKYVDFINLDKIHRVIEWAASGLSNIYCHQDYFFNLLSALKSKFSNKSYNCNIGEQNLLLAFFISFKKNYQKLIFSFIEYIVAKYIHNISFNKYSGLEVNLSTLNHLLREIFYVTKQKFRCIN